MFPEIYQPATAVSDFFSEFSPAGEPLFISSIGTPGAGKSSLLKRLNHELGYSAMGEEVVRDHHKFCIFEQLWYGFQGAEGATWEEANQCATQWGFHYILEVMHLSLLPASVVQTEPGIRNQSRPRGGYKEVEAGWDAYVNSENLGGGETNFPDYLTCIGHKDGKLFPVAFVAPGGHDFALDFSGLSVRTSTSLSRKGASFDPHDIFLPLQYQGPGPQFADAYFFLVDVRLLEFLKKIQGDLQSGSIDAQKNYDNPLGVFFSLEGLCSTIVRQYQRLGQLPMGVPVIGVVSHYDPSGVPLEKIVGGIGDLHLSALKTLERWGPKGGDEAYPDDEIIRRGLSRPVSWHAMETRSDDTANFLSMVGEIFQGGVASKNPALCGASLVSFLENEQQGFINFKETLTQEQIEYLEVDIEFFKQSKDWWRTSGINKPF